VELHLKIAIFSIYYNVHNSQRNLNSRTVDHTGKVLLRQWDTLKINLKGHAIAQVVRCQFLKFLPLVTFQMF